MAAYLSLRHRQTGETYAHGRLLEVDAMLARAMGSEPHEVEWYHGWMDWVGFALAYRCDKSVAEVLGTMMDNARHDEREIIKWFIDNFENSSFHARR